MNRDRAERAARRAAEAAARIDELHKRRQRLVDGQPVTAKDLAQARAAADRQAGRDARAHLDAAETHLDAADVDAAAGDLDQAGHHRTQAAENVTAARAAAPTNEDDDGKPLHTEDSP